MSNLQEKVKDSCPGRNGIDKDGNPTCIAGGTCKYSIKEKCPQYNENIKGWAQKIKQYQQDYSGN